jgi:hypothetical protein
LNWLAAEPATLRPFVFFATSPEKFVRLPSFTKFRRTYKPFELNIHLFCPHLLILFFIPFTLFHRFSLHIMSPSSLPLDEFRGTITRALDQRLRNYTHVAGVSIRWQGGQMQILMSKLFKPSCACSVFRLHRKS